MSRRARGGHDCKESLTGMGRSIPCLYHSNPPVPGEHHHVSNSTVAHWTNRPDGTTAVRELVLH